MMTSATSLHRSAWYAVILGLCHTIMAHAVYASHFTKIPRWTDSENELDILGVVSMSATSAIHCSAHCAGFEQCGGAAWNEQVSKCQIAMNTTHVHEIALAEVTGWELYVKDEFICQIPGEEILFNILHNEHEPCLYLDMFRY